MKVRINDKWTSASSRRTYPSSSQILDVGLVKENKKTVWVRLADGNVIKRKRNQVVEK